MPTRKKHSQTIRNTEASRRERRRRNRRRRKIRLFLRLSGTALILLLAYAWFTNWTNPLDFFPLADRGQEEDFSMNSAQELSESGSSVPSSDSGCMERLEVLAQGNSKVRKVLKSPDRYPSELLEMLSLNEEAADFVLDYPKKKDREPADKIDHLTKGEIPSLLQWDERWGYTTYGSNLLAISGCGPTTLSMVASGLTGDDTLTPDRVAAYAQDNGYYVEGSGSSWSLMTEGCQHFGVIGQELPLSETRLFSELKSGHPIICSMRPGDFTTTGHFIVLTGIKNDKIVVHDPNSKARSKKLWEYETLSHQINNLWSFSLLPEAT